MTDCTCGEPLTDLDTWLDDLVVALAGFSPAQLDQFIEGLGLYEEEVGRLPFDSPLVVAALSGIPIRKALLGIAREVRKLKEIRDGG